MIQRSIFHTVLMNRLQLPLPQPSPNVWWFDDSARSKQNSDQRGESQKARERESREVVGTLEMEGIVPQSFGTEMERTLEMASSGETCILELFVAVIAVVLSQWHRPPASNTNPQSLTYPSLILMVVACACVCASQI